MKEPWYCSGNENHRHPPTENYGSNCSLPSCPQKRPVSQIIRPWLPLIIGGGVLATAIPLYLAFSPKPSPILFVNIVDESASALNNQNFRQDVQQVCETVADNAHSNFDRTPSIIVYSEVEAQDPRLFTSAKSFHQGCQKEPQRHAKAQQGKVSMLLLAVQMRETQSITKLFGNL